MASQAVAQDPLVAVPVLHHVMVLQHHQDVLAAPQPAKVLVNQAVHLLVAAVVLNLVVAVVLPAAHQDVPVHQNLPVAHHAQTLAAVAVQQIVPRTAVATALKVAKQVAIMGAMTLAKGNVVIHATELALAVV